MNKIASWQQALIDSVTNPQELLNLLELDPNLLPGAKAAANTFPLRVPRNFINRMRKRDMNDPLLLQVLPLQEELINTPGYDPHPLQETRFNPIPGLLHKYHGRVLLIWTRVCGVNCRYCFRRNFDYQENNPGNTGWLEALKYIQKDPTISEVILSGGDPLVSNDHTLKNFVEILTTIPHIKRLRIHSRMPIVLPERITPGLISAITHQNIKTILVVHANHPHEIETSVKNAMHLLIQAGVTLLNQTVLLKGVNDDADTLVNLSEALFDAGILPYYLHVLDKVQGSAHFDQDRETSKQLHRQIAQRLSGYLVPKLVCEQPGAPAKLSLEAGEFCTE